MLNSNLRPLIGISKGYFAGKDGFIYSTKTTLTPKALTYAKGNKGRGYYQVCLDGKTRSAHRLIYEAFKGKIPLNKVVSHRDGNRYNNKPDNLLCETQKENLARKKEHGTDDNGFRNSRSKITEEQLTEIKELLTNSQLTHQQIGDKFGVSRTVITKIKNKQSYKI